MAPVFHTVAGQRVAVGIGEDDFNGFNAQAAGSGSGKGAVLGPAASIRFAVQPADILDMDVVFDVGASRDRPGEFNLDALQTQAVPFRTQFFRALNPGVFIRGKVTDVLNMAPVGDAKTDGGLIRS
nr:hypothetical protein [Acetobacterium tundrae]